MQLQKNDFIELRFTGMLTNREIFDSNVPEDLIKLNPENANKEIKSFVFPLGQGMFLQGIEEFLDGKEPKENEEFEIKLSCEKAFGKRDQKLIQTLPINIFYEQKINPIRGVMFNFDGRLAKIISVNGGRVIADFNNPIAGKEVIYKLKFIKKIDDLTEKIKSLNDFFFRRQIEFNINKENQKIIFKIEKSFVEFVKLFQEKFKEILGFDVDVEEKSVEKEIKKEVNEKVS